MQPYGHGSTYCALPSHLAVLPWLVEAASEDGVFGIVLTNVSVCLQTLWNFILSAALGIQKLVVDFCLDGLLPGARLFVDEICYTHPF